MRPVMTITIHIGYTEGSLCRELSLPGGPEVGTSTPRKWCRMAGPCHAGAPWSVM
jgi:hypothetical protein